MLRTHTTKLATLVSTTRAFLVAALLTSEEKFLFFLDFFTWDLLGLVATSAPDSGGQGTGSTVALVAQLLTEMYGVVGATGQGFVAGLPT